MLCKSSQERMKESTKKVRKKELMKEERKEERHTDYGIENWKEMKIK